jgi:hypothetical protein
MSGVIINLSKYLMDVYQPPAAGEIFDTRLKSIQQFELPVNMPKQIALNPGSYLVRAHLPSGEIIDAPATVGDGFEPVQLIASNSPHEWLSWQHYLGNVSAQTDEELQIPPQVLATTWLRVWIFENGKWSAQKAAETGLYRRAHDQACVVIGGYFEPKRLVFLQLGGEFVPQRMIGVPPAPGPIQILIRATRNNVNLNGGVIARIASFDTAVEALCRYISTGAVSAADTLGADFAMNTFGKLSANDLEELNKAESMAKTKLLNPNGAAVGFYYLLRRGAYERMHNWPNNFANWFPWLPDAQAIHAMQCLSDPNRKDLKLALSRLIAGANAGIPVYTVGLRYLYENLCACEGDQRFETEAASVHEAALRLRELAASVDWTEPRTTFYGPAPFSPDCTRVTGIPSDQENLFFLQQA